MTDLILNLEETELIKKFRSLSEMRKGKLSERLEKLYEDEREETALRKRTEIIANCTERTEMHL